MATLYADAAGHVLAWQPTDADEAAGAPIGTVRTVWFDEQENADAVTRLSNATLTAVQIAADLTVTVNGTALTLAPPRKWLAQVRAQRTLATRATAALAQLRAISTQAAALSTQKTAWTITQQQQVATAIKTLADDLLAIARLSANQLDGTD